MRKTFVQLATVVTLPGCHRARLPPNAGGRCPAYPLYHSQMPAISFNVSMSRIPIRR